MSEEPIIGKPPPSDGEVVAHSAAINVLCWKCGAANQVPADTKNFVCCQCHALITIAET